MTTTYGTTVGGNQGKEAQHIPVVITEYGLTEQTAKIQPTPKPAKSKVEVPLKNSRVTQDLQYLDDRESIVGDHLKLQKRNEVLRRRPCAQGSQVKYSGISKSKIDGEDLVPTSLPTQVPLHSRVKSWIQEGPCVPPEGGREDTAGTRTRVKDSSTQTENPTTSHKRCQDVYSSCTSGRETSDEEDDDKGPGPGGVEDREPDKSDAGSTMSATSSSSQVGYNSSLGTISSPTLSWDEGFRWSDYGDKESSIDYGLNLLFDNED